MRKVKKKKYLFFFLQFFYISHKVALKLFKNSSLTNALRTLVNQTPKLMERVIVHARVGACIYCVPRIKQNTKSKIHNPLLLLFLTNSHVLFYHFIIFTGIGLGLVSSYIRPITIVIHVQNWTCVIILMGLV